MSNHDTRSTKRRKLRKKLRAQGYTEAQIAREVARWEHTHFARTSSQAREQPVFDAVSLRRELVADGVDPQLVSKELERREWEYLVAVHGLEEARRIRYSQAPDQPDDRAYRPAYVDPVLTGQARATGVAARVVRSGKTITDWQHREREGR